jgi:hypothetical protein
MCLPLGGGGGGGLPGFGDGGIGGGGGCNPPCVAPKMCLLGLACF